MNTSPARFTFLSGGGEMGQMIRDLDWSQTPLGPPSTWPQSLKTSVGILLSSGYPMYIAWGPRFTQIYNDAYRPILGSTKHPQALGISTLVTFREIWDFIGPMFRDVMDTGRASNYVDQLLLLERHGFREECYFTFSYSALPSDDSVGGVLVTVLETTGRVIQARRQQLLRSLLENRGRSDLAAIIRGSVEMLQPDRDDLPFLLVFESEGDQAKFRLTGSSGIQSADVHGVANAVQTELARLSAAGLSVLELRQAVDVGLAGFEPVKRVACLGIAAPGRPSPQAVLVVGLSSRLEWGPAYQDFLKAIAANIGVVIAEAEALEHERHRAAQLAELDRAKTIFFSDVSHEFRTPIALMIGPIEEAIQATDGEVRENLVIARRNTARLLKLVNSLLDFSRIEAGRMQAQFERVDLAEFTADLASNFRSAMDRAGLKLLVDCPPLPAPVSVDSSMWEKIVLNLLSNAFKHTFEGEIRVALRQQDNQLQLEVGDTGVGIPADQQRVVFERFRRVPNARSRTHEGSGIGLALVRELARMHGGDVGVTSTEGVGSVFTVTLPASSDAIAGDPAHFGVVSRSPSAAAYVEEALRWLPDDSAAPTGDDHGAEALDLDARVLVIDDNADMREYLRRLVGRRWAVRTCADGLSALEVTATWRPDVIVSDVMMPWLDGFELISRLRANPATAGIPVLLLSARAGDEASNEGVRAGADDYLVKPFTAAALYVRVESLLVRSRARKAELEASLRLSRLFEQAPVSIALLRCPEFTYTIANRPYRQLVGRQELLGKTVREALPELEGQGIFELLEQVRTSQAPYVGDSKRLTLVRDGVLGEGWFTFMFQPVVDLQGRTEAVLVVVYEVTELEQAKQAAEQASFAKDEFLAMLGHELRNPMAPMLTALQLMRLRGGGELPKEGAIIERQVNHLMRLVDDLLDVSRVTRGKLEMQKRRMEISAVVSDALEQSWPLIDQLGHSVETDVPATGLPVEADERRLSQVLTNLLTNAAKFTPKGGRIRVDARREGGEVVLRVADSGVGIAADMLPRVFDMFFQARKTFDRSHGGLGLGLAIVRNLVALHGGSVSVSSAGLDLGSQFTIRLPLAGAAPPRVAQEAPPSALAHNARAVLIVDDNEDAANTLAEIMSLRGHLVRVAYDAASAIDIVREWTPDVAFLDLGLPGTSGYELARALRDLPGLEALAVYAVSGYGQSHDRKRSADSGFKGHFVKPVSAEQIESALREAVA